MAALLLDWHYYILEEHPAARTLFCFLSAECFPSVVTTTPEREFEQSNETSKRTEEPRSCSQEPHGWSRRIKVSPGLHSPTQRAKSPNSPTASKSRLVFKLDLRWREWHPYSPRDFVFKTKWALCRLMTCLSQYLFYTVTWTSCIQHWYLQKQPEISLCGLTCYRGREEPHSIRGATLFGEGSKSACFSLPFMGCEENMHFNGSWTSQEKKWFGGPREGSLVKGTHCSWRWPVLDSQHHTGAHNYL